MFAIKIWPFTKGCLLWMIFPYALTSSKFMLYICIWQVHAFCREDAEALASTLEAANVVSEAAVVRTYEDTQAMSQSILCLYLLSWSLFLRILQRKPKLLPLAMLLLSPRRGSNWTWPWGYSAWMFSSRLWHFSNLQMYYIPIQVEPMSYHFI